jgi:hypothetical protein
MTEPDPEIETVLLAADDPLMPFVAVIPAGARLHRVPNLDAINHRIRGLEFERSAAPDRDYGLPLFRKKSRQL